jgi:hypothetical protein
MASYEVLKGIVRSGCSLTLCESIAYDAMLELAALAKMSGAKLTLTTSMAATTIGTLAQTYPGTVSFIDGLDNFKKK